MSNDKEKQQDVQPTPPLSREEDACLTHSIVLAEKDNMKQLQKQRRARILIPSGRAAHEQCPVSVGVNGYQYLISRDKEVSVPQAVLGVLQLATEQTPVLDQEQRIVDFRAVPRFPVQVLGYED